MTVKKRINIDRGLLILIYTLIGCVYGTSFSNPGVITDVSIYHSSAIIGAIMPFTAILLGRKHTVNIGVALFFYAYSSMIFNRHSVFLGESIMPHVLLIGYILLVIFVAQIIEYQNKTKVKLAELEKKQKKDNELMRALSLDLASCAGDEIVPIMTEKIRAYTEAPLVLFAIFNNMIT